MEKRNNAQKKECVGILSLLCRQAKCPQKELDTTKLLDTICSKHHHYFRELDCLETTGLLCHINTRLQKFLSSSPQSEAKACVHVVIADLARTHLMKHS